MKTLITSLGVVVVFGLLTLAPNTIFGQTTTTTITSSGTVSDWSPNAIAVKVDTSPTPVRYTFTKTTTYVDENGNPVSVETVKSGIPVTVYYERNGDSFVADKVVVNKSVTTTADATAPATQLPAPPAVDGIVTDADSDDISVRTELSALPVHYKAHDSTAYVDENGNPVSRKSLTPGTPVTIFYEQSGDNLWATRVVVKAPSEIERQTTTTTRETTMPAP
jgi:hypothetical protein